MYKHTDAVLRHMRRQFIRLFSGYKATAALGMDELNVIKTSKILYSELERLAINGFMLIAERTYEKHGSTGSGITLDWLMGLLNEYNPVTKYVYSHEVDRKRSRFAESVIASRNPSEECQTALRYWSGMVSQYAIEVTDRAALKAYEESGIDKVIWVTVEDERRCKTCLERDGSVYPIDQIPPKSHIGCRCWLKPYRS